MLGSAWIVRGCMVTLPENHKYKSKIHPVYVKIINMISQKLYIGNPHGGGVV